MVERIVLTGGPGSGKSSILEELEYAHGERIIHEAAEDIIKYLHAKGHEKPWELPDFQDYILKLQLQREEQYTQGERVFIDRGILDGLAYYQLHGKSPSEAMEKAIEQTRSRYKKVFLIELGNTCQKTEVRKEELSEALELERLQFRNYAEAGYNVERIPYWSVEDRALKVLEQL